MIGSTLLAGLAILFPGASLAPEKQVSQPSSETVKIVDLPGVGHDGQGFFQLVVEQQLIIRIPARPSSLTNFSATDSIVFERRARPQNIVWRETKAPRCVPMRSLVGIQTVQSDSIDLITRENQRLRAKLNRGCRALDFYSGFYMKAPKDGRLCADRDALQARSGAECQVARFRLMVPMTQGS